MKKYLKELALFSVLGVMFMGAGDALAKPKHAKAAAKPKHVAAQKKDADEDTTAALPHAGEKPLMVLRFNQPSIAYEWPVYNTLTKALEVKPQAEFDVVSVAPRTQDLNQQMQDSEIANGDLTKVLGTLKEIGLPESRYTVSKVYDDVKTSEVRFYIR